MRAGGGFADGFRRGGFERHRVYILEVGVERGGCGLLLVRAWSSLVGWRLDSRECLRGWLQGTI